MSHSDNPFRSFVGVDLHKTTVSLCVVDPNGQVISRTKRPTKCRDRIEQWLSNLSRPVHMAVEACPFVASGDCAEMNSAAAPHPLRDASRPDRFRQDIGNPNPSIMDFQQGEQKQKS